MIAELAENATMFSPPNTPVVVYGDIVGKGFAVEIEDRGLGLSDEQLEHVNELLENPPPFDPSGSDQLGLFVAGQLAKRHNIKITLRPSPYGGITAIVLIPQNLVVPEGSHAKDPSAPAVTDGALRFKGRHALDWARQEGETGTSQEPVATMPTATATAWPDPAAPAPRDPADTADVSPAPLARPGFGEPDLRLEAGGFGDSGQDTGDFGETGLPRRVRQASLVPQLRETAAEPAPGSGGGDFWTRSPEDTRSTMSAIQQGWERGRSAADAPSASTAPGAGNGAEAGDGPAVTPTPDAGSAGTSQSEPAGEDRGTSG
jgi:hypothetical protein